MTLLGKTPSACQPHAKPMYESDYGMLIKWLLLSNPLACDARHWMKPWCSPRNPKCMPVTSTLCLVDMDYTTANLSTRSQNSRKRPNAPALLVSRSHPFHTLFPHVFFVVHIDLLFFLSKTHTNTIKSCNAILGSYNFFFPFFLLVAVPT
jgi:hypothetical protein